MRRAFIIALLFCASCAAHVSAEQGGALEAEQEQADARSFHEALRKEGLEPLTPGAFMQLRDFGHSLGDELQSQPDFGISPDEKLLYVGQYASNNAPPTFAIDAQHRVYVITPEVDWHATRHVVIDGCAPMCCGTQPLTMPFAVTVPKDAVYAGVRSVHYVVKGVDIDYARHDCPPPP